MNLNGLLKGIETDCEKNPWTINEIQEKVEKIMKEGGLGRECVHGVPHIERMIRYYEELFPSANDNEVSSLIPKTSGLDQIDQNLKELLKIAINLHDVGRVCNGDHAENSALVFWNITLVDISEEDHNCIYYAIRNHSMGLPVLGVGKARKREDILLGLLCLVDHLDALGSVGRFRTMAWSKETGRDLDFYNPDLFDAQLYKAVAEGEARFTSREMEKLRRQLRQSKTKSFLEHFLYNLLATEQIVRPVEHLLNEGQKKFIKAKEDSLRGEILSMIEFVEHCKGHS